ncbi:hypothetical protein [Actinoplanes sp. M2I2]|uniref:hypothetical protein n=1 Tax=Actinoplanes sp. M2I2 TaxID=1734444 RepID=UPI0020214176|nr:hypothetical protein [Actinoplanes sp. M2I2]
MKTNPWRSRGLVVLGAMSFVLALGASVVGIVVLARSPSTGTSYEIGRWLLQLATVLAGAGLITAVLRQVEVTRAKRDAWTQMLQDLVVAQDAIENACLRLTSNANGETYADLIERCREMRSMLRRVIALPEVSDSENNLRRQAQRMRHYLKPLIQEYEKHYLRIARQSLLDDKVLLAQLDELAKDPSSNAVTTLPKELLRPSGVGEIVMNPAEFPALTACLQDFEPREGEFRQASEIDRAYESVKANLRSNAGVFIPRR